MTAKRPTRTTLSIHIVDGVFLKLNKQWIQDHPSINEYHGLIFISLSPNGPHLNASYNLSTSNLSWKKFAFKLILPNKKDFWLNCQRQHGYHSNGAENKALWRGARANYRQNCEKNGEEVASILAKVY
jgi:hypothetical protein